MEVILYFLIPISSLVFLFLKDDNKDRNHLMNTLLIMNVVFFFSPLIMAYSYNFPDENSGGESFFWFYIIILPLSVIFQIVLVVLKIIFAVNAKE